MFPKRLLTLLLIAAPLVSMLGCTSSTENPSFPITISKARAELKEMEHQPVGLKRPIVIVGGFLDLGFGPRMLASNLREATGAKDNEILLISLFWCRNFDDCRQKIIAEVDQAFPTNDPSQTRDVDVIGLSMGGIAARYAAVLPEEFGKPAVQVSPLARTTAETTDAVTASVVLSSEAGAAEATAPTTQPAVSRTVSAGSCRRLRVHQMFTLATPHLGATLADVPGFMPLHVAMRRGSDFITRLNATPASADFPIVAYTRVPDGHVGSAYTAPPGQTPIWMPNYLFNEAHLGFFADPRAAADIARRIRGETTYVIEPRAPLPE